MKKDSMTDESNNPHHIINKLRLNPPTQPVREKDCPACGAHSAKQPGSTHCAFCGYEFGDGNDPANGQEEAPDKG